MTLTLADARQQVYDHLDDDGTGTTSGTRWSLTAIDRALATALSDCLQQYAAAGGDRLSTELETTSATDGKIDLSSIVPISISNVATRSGGVLWYAIPAVNLGQRLLDDNIARTVMLVYTRDYQLPTNSAHPLVGVGATAANSWLAFDQWVCARAAQLAKIKDDEVSPALENEQQRLRSSVLSMARIPKSNRFPRPEKWLSRMLGWTWYPNTRVLQVVRRSRF